MDGPLVGLTDSLGGTMFLAERVSDGWNWVGVSLDTDTGADFSMQVCLEGFVKAFGFTPEPGVIYRIEVQERTVTRVDPSTIDRID